ncbi:hypothetical protein [Novosphingobium panipatense]|uniref:hypothetical protein n=1 Tax=Novosphingobium panipatense TaxID=428991 RepID=UPI00362426FB
MKRAAKPAVLLALLAGAVISGCAASEPPPMVPGGPISALPLGTYTCELAGDAGGPVSKPLPEYEFRVTNASTYKAGGVRGSYLLTGEHVSMTGGNLRGSACTGSPRTCCARSRKTERTARCGACAVRTTDATPPQSSSPARFAPRPAPR